MILYGLLVKSEALGSTDGFNILPSTLFGIRPGAEWVRYAVLVSAAAVALVAALLVHRYLGTPLGRLAPAIKDNEIRVEYMGASARRAVHVKYVIAGGLAGVGGALAATAVGHIDPEMAYWTTSGEFIFIAILAGTGNVIAPFVGALIYGAIHTMPRMQLALRAVRAPQRHRPALLAFVVGAALEFGAGPVVELHRLGVGLEPVRELVLRDVDRPARRERHATFPSSSLAPGAAIMRRRPRKIKSASTRAMSGCGVNRVRACKDWTTPCRSARRASDLAGILRRRRYE